jgi:hypothetical protein
MAMKYLRRALVAGLLLAGFIFSPSDLPSCGPFFPEAVFTATHIPPLPDYYRGNLGVLQPTYARKYLFVAYRYLSGQPLSEEEIQSLLDDSSNSSSKWQADLFMIPNAIEEWLKARDRIPGMNPLRDIDFFRKTGVNEWSSYSNCTEDTFKTAAATLQNRIELLGIGHPGIKSWGIAQDAVFSNCARGETIPVAAEPDLPQILQYDRSYQIAAAHFYAEHYDAAAKMFHAIAADRKSPWSEIAPYLVVRCFIRKANVHEKSGTYDTNALTEAERKVRSVLNDRSRASLHPIAGKLEGFIELRLNPLDRIRTIGGTLQRQTRAGSFRQDLIDYLYLMDHASLLPESSMDIACQASEITDWIRAFPSSEGRDQAHSIEKWKTTGSAAWLVAALLSQHTGGPDVAALMNAAQKIPKDSPAYATAQYHRIRLLMEMNKQNEARTALDELLPYFRKSLQNSSLNLFLSQRLKLARNFDEFLKYSPRIPQRISNGDSDSDVEQHDEPAMALFDADSIGILNRALPLNLLSRAATGKLPAQLRMQLLGAVWTRAALISDDGVAAELSREMESTFPVLHSDLIVWNDAKDPDSRRFALAMLLMHFPGMNPFIQAGVPPRDKLDGIDSYRENWWCGFNSGNLDMPTRFRYGISQYEKQKPPEPAKSPDFLSDSDKAKFMAEWKKLTSIPSAPNYFAKSVLAWAEKHPKDERVPEALHLVVKSTRFGCADSRTGSYSRAAFQMLHSRYPNTSWAKSTPYWFR